MINLHAFFINLGLAAVSLLLNHRAVIAQLGIVNIAVALQLMCVCSDS